MINSEIKVLLAEDDEDDIDFFELALISVHPRTNLTTVIDGEQFFRFINTDEAENIDMIFLDINMPRKNGLECLIELRCNKKLDHIPVIMLSTSTNERDVDASFLLGANLYISKSYLLSELSIIKKILMLYEHNELFTTDKKKFVLTSVFK